MMHGYRADQARTQMERGQQQADFERMQQQVQEVESGQQLALQSSEAVRQELMREISRLRDELTTLKQELVALRASQAGLQQSVVDELSPRIAVLLQQAMRPSAGGRTGRSSGAGGREHVVEPGQTLSRIAVMFKVPSSRIIEINQLTDPDHLRVGQRLIIPE